MDASAAPVTLFYSYAHEDEALRPVTSWPNRDEAWTNVAKGLRATVKGIRGSRPVAAGMPDPDTACAAPAPCASPPPLASRSRGMTELLNRVFGAPCHGSDGAAGLQPQAADPLLERVVADVAQQIVQAERQRSPAPLSQDGATRLMAQTRALIDLPGQQRVLWVDERPEGNRFEMAVLAKLQTEVVIARSSDEARQLIADDGEGFSLVISDWERPGEPAPAGLHLLARLRQASPAQPGRSDPPTRRPI